MKFEFNHFEQRWVIWFDRCWALKAKLSSQICNLGVSLIKQKNIRNCNFFELIKDMIFSDQSHILSTKDITKTRLSSHQIESFMDTKKNLSIRKDGLQKLLLGKQKQTSSLLGLENEDFFYISCALKIPKYSSLLLKCTLKCNKEKVQIFFFLCNPRHYLQIKSTS